MRILYTLIISAVLISCEPQLTDKSAGKWYGENPPQLSGQKFKIGSDQAAEMVVKVILDFADMESRERECRFGLRFFEPSGAMVGRGRP